MVQLKELNHLRGIKARHIPYELTDDGWQKNPEHEEDVTLLEYINSLGFIGGSTVQIEGILFMRQDSTLGRDRLDAFTVI